MPPAAIRCKAVFQKGRVYYYCEQGGKHRYPDVERHTCSITGRIIEPLVWKAVAELISNPQQIAAAWETAVEKQDATPDELSRLQNRQRKLERQWVRLLDAFQDGLLNKTELNQRKQRLELERQTIAERSEQIPTAAKTTIGQSSNHWRVFCFLCICPEGS